MPRVPTAWLLLLLCGHLGRAGAGDVWVDWPALSRSFGHYLNLSAGTCTYYPPLSGFILSDGHVDGDKIWCPCWCNENYCNGVDCNVNFRFTFSVPVRRVQFICPNCRQVHVDWTGGQATRSFYLEAQGGSPEVLIQGVGLTDVSLVGEQYLWLSSLQYDFGYEACAEGNQSTTTSEICERYFQEDQCGSWISESDHNLQIGDLCPFSCGSCPESENRTRSTTSSTSSTSTSSSTSSTLVTSTLSSSSMSSTSTSSSSTSSSSTSSSSTSSSSTSSTSASSTTVSDTRSTTSSLTTTANTTSTTSFSTTATSSTSSTSTPSTRTTSTSWTLSSTASSTTATSSTSGTSSGTSTTSSLVINATNASMDQVMDNIVAEMLSNMETQVIRESDTALILAQTLALAPEELLSDDGEASRYLPWTEGMGDVSCKIPSSLLDKAGGALTVVMAALKSSDPTVAQTDGEAPDSAGQVRVSMYDRNGDPIVVRNLAEPVLITLQADPAAAGPLETWTCVFWNETEGRWSTEGVTRVEGESGITCATTHLTLFSALLRQLQCLNVQVLSAEGFATAAKKPWHGSVAGVLLWLLLSGWLLLWFLAWQGSTLQSEIAWKDEDFLLKVPEAQQRPGCLQYCQAFCQNLGSICSLHNVKQLSSARKTDWEEVLALYIGLLGVHCILALRSGTSVTMLRRHLINRKGWIHYSMASSNSEIKDLMQKLSTQVPDAFQHFGQMDFWSRFKLFLRVLHPYSSSVLFCLEQSPLIRMKLKADIMFGALAVSAFFFAATASGTSSASPEVCAQNAMSPWRFILMGFFSASFVSIPVGLAALLWQRSFVDSSNVNAVQRQLWLWRVQDIFLWILSFGYTAFCCLYVALFIANLNGKDHWKWVVTYLTIILRLALLQPVFVCMLLAMAVHVVSVRKPNFFSEGHPDLHFQVQLPVAQEKVKDLASRSVSVAELLSFWEQIPASMPHFDPEVATTHDVVRHVVIPLSKAPDPLESTSYATSLARGCYRPPDVMVTHNWGNRFLHLMAAILSEAMAHRTYETTARLLAQNQIAILQEELRNSLLRRYWICCFCVNQHAAICDHAPELDSTGVPIAKCNCGVPKHWSGAHCEMDKFDAMIGYLAAIVPTFCQVVAVDMNFMVFTRVWCIAELVEARHHRLQQFPIVHSEGSLKHSMEKVFNLDVRNAEASVPADKDRVLEKIHDFDVFNEDLKDLLLNREVGLLSKLSLELCGEMLGAREALDAATHLVVDMLPLPGMAE